MTHADFALPLSQAQAAQLSTCCAAYRAYAWQALPPIPERNQTMKAVQAIQGRLSETRATGTEPLWLVVSEEEKQALRQAIRALMRAYGAEVSSMKRHQQLGELATIRTLIEHMSRQTHAL